MELFGRISLILFVIYVGILLPVQRQLQIQNKRAERAAIDKLYLWAEKIETTGKIEYLDYLSVNDLFFLTDRKEKMELRLAFPTDWLEKDLEQHLIIETLQPEEIKLGWKREKNFWFTIKMGHTSIGGETVGNE